MHYICGQPTRRTVLPVPSTSHGPLNYSWTETAEQAPVNASCILTDHIVQYSVSGTQPNMLQTATSRACAALLHRWGLILSLVPNPSHPHREGFAQTLFYAGVGAHAAAGVHGMAHGPYNNDPSHPSH